MLLVEVLTSLDRSVSLEPYLHETIFHLATREFSGHYGVLTTRAIALLARGRKL